MGPARGKCLWTMERKSRWEAKETDGVWWDFTAEGPGRAFLFDRRWRTQVTHWTSSGWYIRWLFWDWRRKLVRVGTNCTIRRERGWSTARLRSRPPSGETSSWSSKSRRCRFHWVRNSSWSSGWREGTVPNRRRSTGLDPSRGAGLSSSAAPPGLFSRWGAELNGRKCTIRACIIRMHASVKLS